MGANMVRRLQRAGHVCVAYDRNEDAVQTAARDGAVAAASRAEFVARLAHPRAIWMMLPAAVVDNELAAWLPLFQAGDTVIDGGNSYYRDDIRRGVELRAKGLHYLDVGTSGGIWGAERGYCLMIGGEAEVVQRLDPLFAALAPGLEAAGRTRGRDGSPGQAEQGYLHCGPNGAGHFVKMGHNGIEYGLIAAYAEGFNILRHANAGTLAREASAETTPLNEAEF
jgi:6-phosphogluconate dehydrogenase